LLGLADFQPDLDELDAIVDNVSAACSMDLLKKSRQPAGNDFGLIWQQTAQFAEQAATRFLPAMLENCKIQFRLKVPAQSAFPAAVRRSVAGSF
jgi:hypothetical protein